MVNNRSENETDPFLDLPLPLIHDRELAQVVVALGWVDSLDEIYEPISPEEKAIIEEERAQLLLAEEKRNASAALEEDPWP